MTSAGGSINLNTGVITLTYSADPGVTTQLAINYQSSDVATYAAATSLNEAHDLEFGPDGNLYVPAAASDAMLGVR